MRWCHDIHLEVPGSSYGGVLGIYELLPAFLVGLAVNIMSAC